MIRFEYLPVLVNSEEQSFRTPHPCTRKFPCCSAFSLVEVTLSIGIMAFALIVTVGLLPTGLSTFRASMDRTVGAQIAQAIISEKSKEDFGNLIGATGPEVKYFNDEGQETERDADDRVFAAQVEIIYPVSVPSTGSSRFDHFSLAQVRIQIVRSPGATADFGSPASVIHDHNAFFVRR